MSKKCGKSREVIVQIAHITVAISVIECQTWFLINAKQLI